MCISTVKNSSNSYKMGRCDCIWFNDTNGISWIKSDFYIVKLAVLDEMLITNHHYAANFPLVKMTYHEIKKVKDDQLQ